MSDVRFEVTAEEWDRAWKRAAQHGFRIDRDDINAVLRERKGASNVDPRELEDGVMYADNAEPA